MIFNQQNWLVFFFQMILYLIQYVYLHDCSSSNDNMDYMGSLSLTIFNKKCQMWSKHPKANEFNFIDVFNHTFISYFMFKGLEDARNFCRNSNGKFKKERAYCFTNIESNEWDYCQLKKCIGCSRIHGIAYGSLQFTNRLINSDGSFQPGSKINFFCRKNFAIYDQTSGPLEWICGENSQWSANKLPKCLWRGFIDSLAPNCWYFSTDESKDSLPQRLYYGSKNTLNEAKCLEWKNFKKFTDKDFFQEGIINAQNFCRSPGNFEPSCYTDSQLLKNCQIQKCNGCGSIPYIKYTSYDITYIPNPRENTMDSGSIVNYKCSAGVLIGKSNLTCKNGQWDSKLPYCDVKFCSSFPKAPNNTFLTYKRIFYANIEDFGKDYLAFDESIYRFRCKMSYKFDNPTVTELTFQCMTGEWKLVGPNSKCIAEDEEKNVLDKFCPLPSNIENSYRINEKIDKIGKNKYLGTFEVVCFKGYSIQGDSLVSCMNGSWSRYPKCVIDPSCSLDVLNIPAENVKIISSSLFYSPDNSGIATGSYVYYECLPGFKPEFSEDDLKLECLKSGEWSSRIPVKCINF